MLASILSVVGMWLVGIFLYSFGIMQILLTISCSIPVAKNLSKTYIVDTSGIYRKCLITIIFWLVVCIVTIWIIFSRMNLYGIIGFCIGLLVSFLFSIRQLGTTPNNIANHLQAYKKYYPPKVL